MVQNETEGISPKDLSNYQNLIDLFINSRDASINPREVLKDQINFKSDLDEIKKRTKKSKSKDQTSVIKNVQKIFELYFFGI